MASGTHSKSLSLQGRKDAVRVAQLHMLLALHPCFCCLLSCLLTRLEAAAALVKQHGTAQLWPVRAGGTTAEHQAKPTRSISLGMGLCQSVPCTAPASYLCMCESIWACMRSGMRQPARLQAPLYNLICTTKRRRHTKTEADRQKSETSAENGLSHLLG